MWKVVLETRDASLWGENRTGELGFKEKKDENKTSRMGYVAAPESLIPALMKVHQHTAVCAVSFAQKGALSALNSPSDCIIEMVKEFARRRKLVLDYLDQMERISYVKPEGAFYVFPSINDLGINDEELTDYLLKEARVAVVPGSCFGRNGQNHIRIAYSTSYHNLEKGLERMSKALKKISNLKPLGRWLICQG